MKQIEAVAHTLVEEGVDRVFGLMGDGNMRFIDCASRILGLPFVSARHEGAAIGMADGYSRASGQVGVCTVTQGPGITNTVTALVTARKARTPLLLLVGDVAAVQAGWPQDLDQGSLFGALGIEVFEIADPTLTRNTARRAYAAARDAPGPVVLNCPLDLQSLEWNPSDKDLDEPQATVSQARTALVGDPEINQAVAWLSGAAWPVIVAGRGVLRSDCEKELLELAERLGALLATSLPAKGLFADDPFAVGVVGSLGSNVALSLVGRADVILAVGVGLNDFTTLKGTLLKDGARVIRCDVRRDSGPNRQHEDLVLQGDAAAVVGSLVAKVPPGAGPAKARTELVKEQLELSAPQREFQDASEPGGLDPRQLVVDLQGLLPPDFQVVTDVGHFFGFPATYLKMPGPRRYFAAVEFGAVGSGLGVALGVASARPDRLTVLFVGDGGLLMSLPDLETVARVRPRLLIVVMNDGAYGSELHMLRAWGLGEDPALVASDRLRAVAEEMGVSSKTVSSTSDLTDLRDEIPGLEAPLLLDCHVTQRVIASWLEGAFVH